MKKFNKGTIFKLLNIFSSILLLLVIYFFLQNLLFQRILTQKPVDIEVVNISSTDAWIYWKAPKDGVHDLKFKQVSSNDEYEEVKYLNISKDIVNQKRIYSVHLEELQPDTEYVFQIESEDMVWDMGNTFVTKDISEDVEFPDIVVGKGGEKSLLLVDISGEKIMLDTQYHGTYAFDSKGKKFSVSRYSTYVSEGDLREKLMSFLVSPTLAISGANCKTNIKVSSFPVAPSKAKTVDIIDRWVAKCLKGGYPEVCYEDVYCKALKNKVDPAFAMTIWAHESGGSNYAFKSNVEDFGIHGRADVPPANFSKQSDFFLSRIAKASYIDSCTWSTQFESQYKPKMDKRLIMWGARYSTGQCSSVESLAKGYDYMSDLNTVYSWFTNKSFSWPFSTTASSSICNYSNAVTNTSFNTCTTKGAGGSTPDPIGGGGTPGCDKDIVIVTGINDAGKVISPEVDRNCTYKNGCECIWGYNTSKQVSKEAKYGQTCTVSGQVITTPTSTPTPPGGEVGNEPHCGTRAYTYLASETGWPTGSTMCTVGNPSPSSVQFPSPGTSVTWNCVSGGKSTECKAVRLSQGGTSSGPTCGSRDSVYLPSTTNWPTGSTLCTTGTAQPSTVPFPTVGNPSTWSCTDGGKSVTCSASVSATEDVCCHDGLRVSVTKFNECNGRVYENVELSKCVNQDMRYSLKAGNNLILAKEVINYELVGIVTAKELISYSKNKILVVGEFNNGQWVNVVKYENGRINGQDFLLESGKVYLVIASEDIDIEFTGMDTVSEGVELNQSVGWNLVPTKVFTKSFNNTADILNSQSYQYINQLGLWDREVGMFIYTARDESGSIYGESLGISNYDGIFVRVLPK